MTLPVISVARNMVVICCQRIVIIVGYVVATAIITATVVRVIIGGITDTSIISDITVSGHLLLMANTATILVCRC